MAELVARDLVAAALERLPTRYQNAAKVQGLVKSIAELFQPIEDTTIDLITQRTIANATGVHLDRWGAVVGEPRSGASDLVFRRFVNARILTNRSRGTAPEIARIVALLTGSTDVRILESDLLPMAFSVTYVISDRNTEATRTRIRRQVAQAKAAGVNGHWVAEAPAGYFGFSGDPQARGFGVGRWASLAAP